MYSAKLYSETAASVWILFHRLDIGLYSAASDYMVTDIDLSRAVYLAGELAGYEFSVENIETLPGKVVQGELFEEYYVDDEAVREMIVARFYRPVADEDEDE